MCVYVHTKFQVSSMILTSFRQVVILPSLTTTPQNEPLNSPPRLGLRVHLIRITYLKCFILQGKGSAV